MTIRTGIIGIGATGRGLAYQASITRGMSCVAVADCRLERAVAAAAASGHAYRIVESAAEASRAITEGRIAVSAHGEAVAECEAIDVLIEASSAIEAGGRHAAAAIRQGTPVVMMNAESDLIFGPYLLALSREHGVVYTSTDGDQPGVISRLVTEITDWGFELVMAGNMKGFLDRYADATSIAGEAAKRDFDPKMTAGYTDGSKVCIEMALVANALGMSALKPGMHGPHVPHVRDVLGAFDFEAIRARGPAVDYVLGAQPDGGVFVVGYCGDAQQQRMLSVYKMGDGPFYVFYRPYHLCHVEAMATVRDAVRGVPLLQPHHGFRTNVFAYAKRDLRAGDALDGFGGYACYGLIENCGAAVEPGLPLCLAENVRTTRSVRRDERLSWNDIDHSSLPPAFEMYRRAVTASSGYLSGSSP